MIITTMVCKHVLYIPTKGQQDPSNRTPKKIYLSEWGISHFCSQNK